MQARHVAWTAAGISLVLAVVDTALVAASYPPFSMKSTGIHGWPLVNLAGLGSAVLGAVILTAHPRHPIGWILSFIGLSTSISLATESYGIWVLQYDGHGTAAQGQLAGWVAAALGGPMALALLTGVFLLVPGGHVPVGPVALGRPRGVGRDGAVPGRARPRRPERHQPQRGRDRCPASRPGDSQRRRHPDHADASGQRRRDAASGSAEPPARPASSSGSSRSGRPASA